MKIDDLKPLVEKRLSDLDLPDNMETSVSVHDIDDSQLRVLVIVDITTSVMIGHMRCYMGDGGKILPYLTGDMNFDFREDFDRTTLPSLRPNNPIMEFAENTHPIRLALHKIRDEIKFEDRSKDHDLVQPDNL